jgi:hypothetical protein
MEWDTDLAFLTGVVLAAAQEQPLVRLVLNLNRLLRSKAGSETQEAKRMKEKRKAYQQMLAFHFEFAVLLSQLVDLAE